MRRLLMWSVLLAGCATSNATTVPYDPNLLTVSRQGAADRWAADVARRQYVSTYMNAICAPDGPWAQISEAWVREQKTIWTDILWKFEPVPAGMNRPTNVDWSSILNVILGSVIKLAPLALRQGTPQAATPLPPC